MMKVVVLFYIILCGSCITLACKCDWHGVHTAKEADVVLSVATTDIVTVTDKLIYYQVRVLQVFKGCVLDSLLKVVTPSVPEACGLVLEVPQNYILTGSMYNKLDNDTLFIHSCGYNVPLTRVSMEEENYLDNLYNPCTNQCATGTDVDCFASPCSVSSCDVKDAVCEDNYCNGCNAYWWSNDFTCLCLYYWFVCKKFSKNIGEWCKLFVFDPFA